LRITNPIEANQNLSYPCSIFFYFKLCLNPNLLFFLHPAVIEGFLASLLTPEHNKVLLSSLSNRSSLNFFVTGEKQPADLEADDPKKKQRLADPEPDQTHLQHMHEQKLRFNSSATFISRTKKRLELVGAETARRL
jgi:hypothetical protein